MDSLKVIVGRIEQRLTALGLSATAASKKAGLSQDAIRNLRRGARGEINVKGGLATTYAALAPVLGTTSQWLTSGIGSETGTADDQAEEELGRRMIRVVGYVGAGAEAHYYAVAQGDLDEVEAPDGTTESTVAVEIRGDSLGSLFDRWLVFYDDVRRPVTPDLIGKLCVVGLADDRILIKRLRRAKNGLFDLESNQTGETIRAVAIEWAAKVRVMTPR